jgi:hypothetical protein
MRLLIIGTSHVATLKQGWQLLAPPPADLTPTIFGAPLGKLASLKPDRDHLVSADAEARGLLLASGGAEAVTPGAFDAALLVGMRLYVPRLDLRNSSALRAMTLADVMAGPAMTLAKKLRRLAPLPLFFAPEPLWADLPRYRRGEAHLIGYAEVLAQMQARLPLPRARILPQPPQTISPAQLTPLDYSVETQPLAEVEAAGRVFDQVHMNARFGAEWWTANLPRMLDVVSGG